MKIRITGNDITIETIRNIVNAYKPNEMQPLVSLTVNGYDVGIYLDKANVAFVDGGIEFSTSPGSLTKLVPDAPKPTTKPSGGEHR